MATSNRRTVVHNNGSLNKGGTKTVYSYNKEGNMTSVRTIRGSVNNKSGGADNQYSTNTYTPDKPSSKSKSTNSSSRTTKNSDSGSGAGLLLGIVLIVFLLIWKALVWLYELV